MPEPLAGNALVALGAMSLVAADRSAPPARTPQGQSDYWLVGGDGAV